MMDFIRRRWVLGIIAFLFSWYACSYWRGVTMAFIDHTCGHYELKVWGLRLFFDGEDEILLREKYGVETDMVGGCSVFPTTEMYARGYNSISKPLLLKKYGKDIFEECWVAAVEQRAAEHPRK
jgi:hypothetical protein